MRLRDRDVKAIAGAAFNRRHYMTLWNMIRLYPNFPIWFPRYLFNTGSYPRRIKIRTPLGLISPGLYSYHDLLTVNEIFCREDYPAPNDIKVVVDIGSNIGISALYFLTRNKCSKCYLFEPVPENTRKIRSNLKQFNGRFDLNEAAVADRSGTLEFGVETTGRYGGLDVETGQTIKVECIHINDVLKRVLRENKRIDILKLDIEGAEIATMNAIHTEHLKRINVIFFETNMGDVKQLRPARR